MKLTSLLLALSLSVSALRGAKCRPGRHSNVENTVKYNSKTPDYPDENVEGTTKTPDYPDENVETTTKTPDTEKYVNTSVENTSTEKPKYVGTGFYPCGKKDTSNVLGVSTDIPGGVPTAYQPGAESSVKGRSSKKPICEVTVSGGSQSGGFDIMVSIVANCQAFTVCLNEPDSVVGKNDIEIDINLNVFVGEKKNDTDSYVIVSIDDNENYVPAPADYDSLGNKKELNGTVTNSQYGGSNSLVSNTTSTSVITSLSEETTTSTTTIQSSSSSASESPSSSSSASEIPSASTSPSSSSSASEIPSASTSPSSSSSASASMDTSASDSSSSSPSLASSTNTSSTESSTSSDSSVPSSSPSSY